MRKFDRNDRVLLICVGVFAGMVGLTYASVPLYRFFCQATGFDGTPRIATEESRTIAAGVVQVRFDANVAPGLPWEFRPEQNAMSVRLGANNVAFYRAHNTSSRAVAGTAKFNVTPDKAAKYFNKTQCFCFISQELKAGQFANMGVSFFVDPAIANDPETRDVTTVTLSYTFYPDKSDSKTVAAANPR